MSLKPVIHQPPHSVIHNGSARYARKIILKDQCILRSFAVTNSVSTKSAAIPNIGKSQLYISFLYHLIVGKCSVSGGLTLIVLHFFVIELENCLESFLAGGDKKTAVGVSIFQYLNDSKERCFLACLQVLLVDGFK